MEKQAQNGFTLLEVIVAISILMFGILAVASMQSASMRGNALSMSLTEGTTLAADRVERILTRSYTHADLTAGNHTDPSPPAGFTITWVVTDNTDSTLIADTKTVLLTISWVEHGVPQSLTVPRVIPRVI
jgi:prepilin-type N-terminal cleavage/methylation domain-containing protein